MFIYLIFAALVTGYELGVKETSHRIDGADLLLAIIAGLFWPIWILRNNAHAARRTQ